MAEFAAESFVNRSERETFAMKSSIPAETDGSLFGIAPAVNATT
jgi:hypothetical protein